MNIFQGARRIAIVIGVLYVAGWITYAVITKPFIAVDYAYQFPDDEPKRTDTCPSEAASRLLTVKMPQEQNVYVSLCVLPQTALNGTRLIPFLTGGAKVGVPSSIRREVEKKQYDKGQVDKLWRLAFEADQAGNEVLARSTIKQINLLTGETHYAADTKHSENVTRAMQVLEQKFQFPKGEAAFVEQLVKDKRYDVYKQAGLGIAVGLVVWFVFVFGMGWIVRGFAGIPMGKDSKA